MGHLGCLRIMTGSPHRSLLAHVRRTKPSTVTPQKTCIPWTACVSYKGHRLTRRITMFGFISKDTRHAVEILKLDHRKVQELFDQFEKTTSRAAKIRISQEALTDLKVHAAIEEEIFYPAVRRK